MKATVTNTISYEEWEEFAGIYSLSAGEMFQQAVLFAAGMARGNLDKDLKEYTMLAGNVEVKFILLDDKERDIREKELLGDADEEKG